MKAEVIANGSYGTCAYYLFQLITESGTEERVITQELRSLISRIKTMAIRQLGDDFMEISESPFGIDLTVKTGTSKRKRSAFSNLCGWMVLIPSELTNIST